MTEPGTQEAAVERRREAEARLGSWVHAQTPTKTFNAKQFNAFNGLLAEYRAAVEAAIPSSPPPAQGRSERLFVIEAVRQFVANDPLGGGRERTLKFLDGIEFSENFRRSLQDSAAESE